MILKLLDWNPKTPFVLNLHITKACNMKCVFCFGGFKETKHTKTKEEWMTLIKKIGQETQFLPDRRLNFAGGEPLLVPYLPELLALAKQEGFKTSIITNGSRLTEAYLDQIADHVDLIGLSIDSLDEELNQSIGRKTLNGVLSKLDYLALCQQITDRGIPLKVNTVIHQGNYHQDLSPLLKQATISRWKVLRMLPIENENGAYNHLYPSDEAFNDFILRHQAYRPIVEDNEDMKSTYLFVSPEGLLMDNSTNQMVGLDSLFEISLKEAFEKLPFNYQSFLKRY